MLDVSKMVDAMLDAVDVPLRKFNEHIKALEARIAELEAVPQLTDGGIWGAEKVYRPGQVVTDGGSAWVCKEANSNSRPGSNGYWRLMVKRGKDARWRIEEVIAMALDQALAKAAAELDEIFAKSVENFEGDADRARNATTRTSSQKPRE